MRRTTTRLASLAFGGALLWGCGGPPDAPPPNPPSDLSVEVAAPMIEVANAEFMAAAAAKDAAAMTTALYANNAIVMAPNQEPIVGLDAITANHQLGIDNGVEAIELITTEVLPAGDRVIETGVYRVLGPGDVVFGEGKYMGVWKMLDDGTLRIYRDIWNSGT